MKGKIVFPCLLDLFPCSVTVTGAVKKSLFEYLVHCGTDEADKTMKTVIPRPSFSSSDWLSRRVTFLTVTL